MVHYAKQSCWNVIGVRRSIGDSASGMRASKHNTECAKFVQNSDFVFSVD